MTSVGVAVVGGGMVAELHVQAIRNSAVLSIRGLVDIDSDVAHRRTEEWQVPAYADLDAALDDPTVDAVLVLTPQATHCSVALQAMARGKHVLVEKPVGTLAEIRQLQAAAEGSGLVCMPGHNYAYQPEFTQLRRLTRTGAFGNIRALWITYIIKHSEEVASHYGGVLDEIMIHHSYLALALFGPPRRLSAGRAEPAWQHHTSDDQAWMTWEYAGGLSAHLFASMAVEDTTSDPWMFMVKVLGDNGGATYNWNSALFRRPLGSLPFALPAYEESYEHEHRAFAAAIGGEPVVSPLSDAYLASSLVTFAGEYADSAARGVDVSSLADPGEPA